MTDWRAKPAVPFGGKHRIIDFPLSNCINSGIRRIGVVTQYKAHNLIQHIQRGWGFLRGEFNEFVELLPAQQRIQEEWYKGTADAIFQNIDILCSYDPKFVVILAGDHIHKMDYGKMLAFHVNSKADMTIGCYELPVSEVSAFGVMVVGEGDRVTIIPHLVSRYRVYAHRFEDSCVGMGDKPAYWRDVGTVDAYWEANMELIKVVPDLNLYDKTWRSGPIRNSFLLQNLFSMTRIDAVLQSIPWFPAGASSAVQ
nr:sugar phosphate nucleotidyltransferase [Ferrovum myxofaciens]